MWLTLLATLPLISAHLEVPLLHQADRGALLKARSLQSDSNQALPKRQTSESYAAQLTQQKYGYAYYIPVQIGTPPQQISLQLGTLSNALWVPYTYSAQCQSSNVTCPQGAFNPAQSTTYNLVTANGFNDTYFEDTTVAGDWFTDLVSIGGGPLISNVSIGLAKTSADVWGGQGVIELGYGAAEVPYPATANRSYATVLERMVSNRIINRKAYGLYLNDYNSPTGSLCFGCVDSTKYTGDLTYLPLQQRPGVKSTTPFYTYVTLSAITFHGSDGTNTSLTDYNFGQSFYLDAGWSNNYLPVDIFNAVAAGYGAVYDSYYDAYLVPCAYGDGNATMEFSFGGAGGPSWPIQLGDLFNGQVYNESQTTMKGGACDFGFYPDKFGDPGFGLPFLRNAYVVFDLDYYRVAMAEAVPSKTATSNIKTIASTGDIPGATKSAVAVGTSDYSNAATGKAIAPNATFISGTLQSGTPTFNINTETEQTPSHKSTPTSTPTPHPGGLSTGAKIGLGLGIGLGVPILLGLLAFFLLRRRKQAQLKSTYPNSTTSAFPPTSDEKASFVSSPATAHTPHLANHNKSPVIPTERTSELYAPTSPGGASYNTNSALSPDMHQGSAFGGTHSTTSGPVSGTHGSDQPLYEMSGNSAPPR